MKVCKICGTMREPHASHRCSNNKLVKGRSSKMIPINTTYQYSVLSDNGEYVVKNKPYIYEKFDYIVLNLYENGLESISEVFKSKTVEEVFEICSKLKIDYSIEYNKDFVHFDFEEYHGMDDYTGEMFIKGLKIKLYKVNKYEN